MRSLRISSRKTKLLRQACASGDFEAVQKLTNTQNWTYADVNADVFVRYNPGHYDIVKHLLSHKHNRTTYLDVIEYICKSDNAQLILHAFSCIPKNANCIKGWMALAQNKENILEHLRLANPDWYKKHVYDILSAAVQSKNQDMIGYLIGVITFYDTIDFDAIKSLINPMIETKNNVHTKKLLAHPSLQNHPNYHTLLTDIVHKGLDIRNYDIVEYVLFSPHVSSRPYLPIYECESDKYATYGSSYTGLDDYYGFENMVLREYVTTHYEVTDEANEKFYNLIDNAFNQKIIN